MPEDSTLLDLIETLGYGPRQVVAERNGEAVERSRFGEIVLAAGDRIEIVRAVAGGSSEADPSCWGPGSRRTR